MPGAELGRVEAGTADLHCCVGGAARGYFDAGARPPPRRTIRCDDSFVWLDQSMKAAGSSLAA